MKKYNHNSILNPFSCLKRKGLQKNVGFTLVEIMVAITIFMIVMVSVLQIFGISVNITNRVDINRQVQENIKNLTETIAENIRQNNILGVGTVSDTYNLTEGNGIRIGENKYYLSMTDDLARKIDISECAQLKNNCFLVRNDGISLSRLTNSWVAFENISFKILGTKVKRLVLNFTIRPATKKGIPSTLIKNSKVDFQTTLSERFIKTK